MALTTDFAPVAQRPYYNVSEVAALLGVSRVSVWRWISSGRLPVARLGHRTVRIRAEDVQHVARTGRGRGGHMLQMAPAAHWQTAGGASDHVVMFYEDERFLLDSVAGYMLPALKHQDGRRGVLVSTPAHRDGIEARLTAMGIDVAVATAEGRYVAEDAAVTLSSFMVDGMPRADLFDAIVDRLVEGATADRRVRIFGEMVALLVADGRAEAALALESLWNRAQQTRPFQLLCGYPIQQFSGEALELMHARTCAAHTSVVPTERYTASDNEPDRLREIAALQQKAASLELELAERRRLAEQLERALDAERQARDEAEAALRVRDEFLSTASHELRTPVAVLGVQAQMMLRNWQRTSKLDPERVVKALRNVGSQTDRLGRLINQLLDASRLDARKLEVEPKLTDLTELVKQVVSMRQTLSSDRPIELSAPPTLACVVDPLRIEQVLINLLDNAAKYSPPSAPIGVTLSERPGVAELAVRDHGRGIPPDKRDRIFERFFQAHENGARTGLGLGLYLSRTIVELHGGALRAEFPQDGGSRFVVTLPR